MMLDTAMPVDGTMPADGAIVVDAMPVDLGGVDDLFGDVGAIPLPAAQANGKQLLQRIEALRTRGCQQ